jgi:EmrB/QacA subfamily drug resistance transporter
MPVGQSNPLQPSRHSRRVFAVVAAAIFMSNLDLFIVNVALPSIGRDFGGSSLARLSWILNGYAIAFAALLIAAGRLGDRIGQRRVFLAGIGVFTLASALCAAAPNLAMLIAARVLQAAGAAALIPTSLALLLAATPAERRSGAVRGWAAIGGVSAALGPVIGGLLVQADWRWVFLVNLPVGIAAIVVGRRVLPHPAGRPSEPLPDLVGAALLTVGIAALTGALVEAPGWGWDSARTIGLFAASAVALGWFITRCRTHERPLIELSLLRIPSYGAATAAVFLFSLGFAAMLLSNVLWCQDVWQYSALKTGLAVSPGPAMVPALAIGAGPLVRRFGPGAVAAAGNLVFAAGLLWRVLAVGTTPDYAGDLLPSMLLTGIGVGLALPTLISTTATALPAERFGTGSAIVNTSRQVASALGVAILVTILGTPTSAEAARIVFRHSWIAAAVANVAAAIVCLRLRRPGLPGRSGGQLAAAEAGTSSTPGSAGRGSGKATAPVPALAPLPAAVRSSAPST